MRVAVVHDWLGTYAGAARVTEQILACYPEADLYCVVDFLPEGERAFLRGKTPQPDHPPAFSPGLQQIPGLSPADALCRRAARP